MPLDRWRYTWPLRLRSLFRRGRVDQELDDELQDHIERQIDEHVARGLTREQARTIVLRAFGGMERHKEECRDSWVIAPLDHLARDTRQACRALRRDLGFTAGVFLLLALGIGANVAVFSIVNGVLLRPLPYSESDRLFVVPEVRPRADEALGSVNALHYLEWQRECDCFEDIALSEWVYHVNLSGNGGPERVPSVRVTPNAFEVLGVSAQIGRTFVPEDAEPAPSAREANFFAPPKVVLISDGLWRRRYGADPAIVGKTINMDGQVTVVVGVLPPGFRHDWGKPDADAAVDLYKPWALTPLPPWWNWSNNYSYTALGRLADGVSVEAALEELNSIQAAIAAEHIEHHPTLRAALVPLHDWLTGHSREGLLLLLAAVGVALLVACLNIANLMLVRAAGRSREAGVRAALGASRTAIVRGVLIESGMLACAGAAAGVGLAAASLQFFASFAPAGLPRVDEVQMDGAVLLAALGFAVAATLLFGLLPALRMTRADPQDALRVNSRAFTDSGRQLRVRQALVSVEVGLSTCLLIVAGLLVMSFIRLDAVARGFDARNVLTASIGLPGARYGDDAAKRAFYDRLLERLRHSPGVAAAGLTSVLPLTGSMWGSRVIPAGENPPVEERPRAEYRFVSPGYLEAMGIPLLAGRSLSPRDDERRVAVLSERAARLAAPDEDPVGRRFWRGSPDELFEIVGLVPDVPSEGLAVEPTPLVYAPLTATGGAIFPYASIAVRTEGDPTMAVGVLRDAVASLDPELALSDVRTMRQIERASLGERRLQLWLVVAFGAASLLIAAVGTYSVLAYTVASRTNELAIRLALGARPSAVRAMVLRQGMRPILVGLAAGVVTAVILGRFLSSLLYSVTPRDPATLTTVVAVTLVAALLASWLPARRAARTSLQDALRYE
jgi:predicted permease